MLKFMGKKILQFYTENFCLSRPEYQARRMIPLVIKRLNRGSYTSAGVNIELFK